MTLIQRLFAIEITNLQLDEVPLFSLEITET